MSVQNKTDSRLERYLKFLIERGFVDNEDDSSETVHRFLEIFEQFEEDDDASSENEKKGGEETQFETRGIFTLADFLKSLGPNEYYDIAQKVFNQWDRNDDKKIEEPPLKSDSAQQTIKLTKLAKIMEKQLLLRK